jgi:hypothetical protein
MPVPQSWRLKQTRHKPTGACRPLPENTQARNKGPPDSPCMHHIDNARSHRQQEACTGHPSTTIPGTAQQAGRLIQELWLTSGPPRRPSNSPQPFCTHSALTKELSIPARRHKPGPKPHTSLVEPGAGRQDNCQGRCNKFRALQDLCCTSTRKHAASTAKYQPNQLQRSTPDSTPRKDLAATAMTAAATSRLFTAPSF